MLILTYIVIKYVDNATVKASTKLKKTKLPSDRIFTKYDTSNSDDQVKKLTREFNIHYRDFIGSFIYLLSTRVDSIFAVHKLENFSANPSKVHFEGLIRLLRYIIYNRTLALKYYADMNDAPVYDLLRKDIIKTENHSIYISDSSWQYFPDTCRST